jgi:hypothetical protein
MQKISCIAFTCLCCLFTTGQINSNLKKELDSLFQQDQKIRQLLFSDVLKTSADSIAASYNISKERLTGYLIEMMPVVDSLNLQRVEQIIQQYGYPGRSLVGEGTNEAAFFIIQHSRSIDKYLPLVRKAAEQNELSFSLYAMMLDRSLMYNGKEQLYGTQGNGFEVLNPQTNKKEFKRIIWPVKDPATVNERRKNAGFKETIEENAKRLGIEYQVLTLEQVKQMQQKKD